jgi:hypothetical protein
MIFKVYSDIKTDLYYFLVLYKRVIGHKKYFKRQAKVCSTFIQNRSISWTTTTGQHSHNYLTRDYEKIHLISFSFPFLISHSTPRIRNMLHRDNDLASLAFRSHFPRLLLKFFCRDSFKIWLSRRRLNHARSEPFFPVVSR